MLVSFHSPIMVHIMIRSLAVLFSHWWPRLSYSCGAQEHSHDIGLLDPPRNYEGCADDVEHAHVMVVLNEILNADSLFTNTHCVHFLNDFFIFSVPTGTRST
jgi:hypothetical protein